MIVSEHERKTRHCLLNLSTRFQSIEDRCAEPAVPRATAQEPGTQTVLPPERICSIPSVRHRVSGVAVVLFACQYELRDNPFVRIIMQNRPDILRPTAQRVPSLLTTTHSRSRTKFKTALIY